MTDKEWHEMIDQRLEQIAKCLESEEYMEAGIRLGIVLEKNMQRLNEKTDEK